MNYSREQEKRQVIQENLKILVDSANEILENPDAPLPEEMTIPHKSKGYTSQLTLRILPLKFRVIEGTKKHDN